MKKTKFIIGDTCYHLDEIGLSTANRSAARKAFFQYIRTDKRARLNDYPVIFWVKEDFILEPMEQLLFNISKN